MDEQVHGWDRGSLNRQLASLYQQQLAAMPEYYYLRLHQRPKAIDNRVRTFEWYRSYLPNGGTALDWGCNHEPDSCLLRMWYGDQIELHSCDFDEPDRFPVFHQYSRSTYQQLTHEVHLPYPDNHFDLVVASGVLEHVALDYESLKELRRIIKPLGTLMISYLPNWLSVNEWRRRTWRKDGYHRRLYGRREMAYLLKHSGFVPHDIRYHTFIWERAFGALGLGCWEQGLTKWANRLVPLQVTSSTLRLIAQKITIM